MTRYACSASADGGQKHFDFGIPHCGCKSGGVQAGEAHAAALAFTGSGSTPALNPRHSTSDARPV
jgi:hypothetical protein